MTDRWKILLLAAALVATACFGCDRGFENPLERCGDGVRDPGERCDGDCPTTCDDGNACTTDALVGSPASCDAHCEFAPATGCGATDVRGADTRSDAAPAPDTAPDTAAATATDTDTDTTTATDTAPAPDTGAPPASVCADPVVALSDPQEVDWGSGSCETSLVWTGAAWGLVWLAGVEGTDQLRFASFTPDGAAEGGGVTLTADPVGCVSPSLAWTGSEYGVAWISFDRQAAFLTRFGAGGAPVHHHGPLSPVSGDSVVVSGRASLAWAVDRFGVAWNDTHSGEPLVYLGRYDAAGVALGDVAPVGGDGFRQHDPHIVAAGEGFAVAWTDRPDEDSPTAIGVALFSAEGQPAGDPLRVTAGGGPTFDPWLAWTGRDFLLAWSEDVAGVAQAGVAQIHLARISAEGAVVGGPWPLTDDPEHEARYPRLAAFGDGFALVWQHDWSLDTSTNELRLVPIAADGAVGGPTIRVGDAGVYTHAPPAIASRGAEVGVAWIERVELAGSLRFARVSCRRR